MCSDTRMIPRFWLRIPKKSYLSFWRQHGRVYPGSRGPFSKHLILNKPCLRFDKAPETLFFSVGASRLVDAASPRTISIDKKKISSGTQGRHTVWTYGCSGSRSALTTSGISCWSSWVQFLRVHALVNDQLVASCQLGLSTLLRPIWIIRYELFAWVECRVREWTPYSGFQIPRFMILFFFWGETKTFFFFYQRGAGRWGLTNFWCYLQAVLVWLMHKHVHELDTEKSYKVYISLLLDATSFSNSWSP